MVASDRLAIDTAEQKNAVESYVYEMRNKLDDSLSPYTTAQVLKKKVSIGSYNCRPASSFQFCSNKQRTGCTVKVKTL